MNGINRRIAKKIIKRYKKELSLLNWSIDCEIAPVKSILYTNLKKKEALVVINKKEVRTIKKLNTVIKCQLILLKEKIFNNAKKNNT